MRLVSGPAAIPATRISPDGTAVDLLDIGGRVSARMLPADARALASALLAHADAIEEGAFLAACAKECRCCGTCSQVPCAACTAGGICDAFRCTCDDEPELDYDDGREDGFYFPELE